jgi:hypothetical protein
VNIFLLVGIGIVLLFVLCIRRSPKPSKIVQSLSTVDRRFIADQIEPITELPLVTIEDELAWLVATRAAMERLGTRFSEVASVVPGPVYQYFDDADIHRKEPSHRAASETRVREFLRLLRQEPANA